MTPKLCEELKKWKDMWPTIFKREPESKDFLFPGRDSFEVHMTSQNVDYALRAACKKLGIVGANTFFSTLCHYSLLRQRNLSTRDYGALKPFKHGYGPALY